MLSSWVLLRPWAAAAGVSEPSRAVGNPPWETALWAPLTLLVAGFEARCGGGLGSCEVPRGLGGRAVAQDEAQLVGSLSLGAAAISCVLPSYIL